ncbi:hypothetical protein GCM10011415_16360 [Salipiger pallidus]|uniref:Dihydroxy-acid dehydratase n=2 Tax=Salipiger pallidus TaxID=1775170 RepID=A0A8J3EG80_9RHOB|nr:hypothetical protein GCM10011415_16360 [Salipiger pallidus]
MQGTGLARRMAAFGMILVTALSAAACTEVVGDAPLKQATLAGGDVVVAGPRNYCVDPQTLPRGSARSFAMIASCNILSGGERGDFVEPVLVTVTTGPFEGAPVLPSPRLLAEEVGHPYAGGENGGDITLAQLGAGGNELLEGGDPRYWRAAFVLNNHVVGLALYAPEGSRMAAGTGAQMLRQVRDSIVAASPRRAQDSAPGARAFLANPSTGRATGPATGKQAGLPARLFDERIGPSD